MHGVVVSGFRSRKGLRQEQGQSQMGMETGRDRTGRGVRRGAAILGLAGLAACSPTERFHGYVPAEAVLSTISLGEDPAKFKKV